MALWDGALTRDAVLVLTGPDGITPRGHVTVTAPHVVHTPTGTRVLPVPLTVPIDTTTGTATVTGLVCEDSPDLSAAAWTYSVSVEPRTSSTPVAVLAWTHTHGGDDTPLVVTGLAETTPSPGTPATPPVLAVEITGDTDGPYTPDLGTGTVTLPAYPTGGGGAAADVSADDTGWSTLTGATVQAALTSADTEVTSLAAGALDDAAVAALVGDGGTATGAAVEAVADAASIPASQISDSTTVGRAVVTAADAAAARDAIGVIPPASALGWGSTWIAVTQDTVDLKTDRPIAGRVHVGHAQVLSAGTVTGAVLSIAGDGSSPTVGASYMGLYNSAGNLVAATASGDVEDVLDVTSYGYVKFPFTTPYVAALGEELWVAMLMNFATTPVVMQTYSGSVGMEPPMNLRWGYSGTGQLSLPAAITLPSLSITRPYWYALYR